MRNVAIITDGNGRWAQTRGLPVNEGHEAGADTLKARLRDAIALGVRQLTVYSFSTENWSRPPDEVLGLMAMLGRRIAAETPRLSQAGIRMRFVGRREGAPRALVEQMQWAETVTAANGRPLVLFIALNYGGRAEIMDATQSAFAMAAKRSSGAVSIPRICMILTWSSRTERRATPVQLLAMAGSRCGARVPA